MGSEVKAGSGMAYVFLSDALKQLAQRLATRLQYAAFKVERGWVSQYTAPSLLGYGLR